MRKSKKQLLRTLMACGLVVSVAAGGTVAYLTDAETATNTFTVGKVKIDLEEPGYPGNDSDEVKNIIPNQEIVKDPQIENTGNNDALVFLRVEVPQEEFTELDTDNNVGEKKLQDLFKLKNVSDQWELLRTETTTGADGKTKTSYVYGYKHTLAKGSTTDKLFQKVQMKNSIEKDLEGNVEDVIVTACAIQATDIPDIDLTPGSDGILGKDVLDQVYTIFLNQSGEQKSRPADEGNKPQDGSIGKITYELDGGSITGAKKSYTTADYGYAPPAPTKKGYKFTGWEPENIPADSTGNVTFTAKWEEKKEVTTTLLKGGTRGLSRTLIAIAGSAENVKAFQKSDIAPTDEIKASAQNISDSSITEPIYAWFEKDSGTIKYWSDTDTIYMNFDSSYFFNADTNNTFSNLSDISGLTYLDSSKVSNMARMFNGCTNLTDLTPIANWNVVHVTDMNNMFDGCSSLSDLAPLTNWNTEKVSNMSWLFGSCNISDLTPIANWKTDSVRSAFAMFQSCKITNLLPLKNWDVSNIENMAQMFYDCTNLMDASAINDWDINKATAFHAMFKYCPSHPEFTKRTGAWDKEGTFTPTT